MTYVRNSVLRARGEKPNHTNPRARARRAEAALAQADAKATQYLVGLKSVEAITSPIIERARERGTDSGGTIRRIARTVEAAIG